MTATPMTGVAVTVVILAAWCGGSGTVGTRDRLRQQAWPSLRQARLPESRRPRAGEIL
jgi:hypothetical protein